jgi:hypothetical protein
MAQCCDADNQQISQHRQSDDSQITTPAAIMLSEVFWPNFVYHDGRVYLENTPDADDYLELLMACDYDKTTVQALCNHRHLLEYCVDIDATNIPTREQLIAFGQRLQVMWQAKLAQDYPNLNVIVAFDVQEEDSLDDLQIVVYQEDEE